MCRRSLRGNRDISRSTVRQQPPVLKCSDQHDIAWPRNVHGDRHLPSLAANPVLGAFGLIGRQRFEPRKGGSIRR